MWYLWTALLVVSCALVSAGGAGERPAPATTRAPPRTLDRQAAELAWRTWLQSPESNNQNAPPRRIITKSLFITPLVCPKGQRLDGKDCVEVIFPSFLLLQSRHPTFQISCDLNLRPRLLLVSEPFIPLQNFFNDLLPRCAPTVLS